MTRNTVELLNQALKHLQEDNYEELQKVMNTLLERASAEEKLQNVQKPTETLGKQVLLQLKDWLQAVTKINAPFGMSPPVVLKSGLDAIEFRPPQLTGIVETKLPRAVSLVQLFNRIPVSTDVVRYVVVGESASEPYNAWDLRHSNYSINKPALQLTYTAVDAQIETHAAIVTVTRQALADTPALERILNTQLAIALTNSLEYACANILGTTSGVNVINIAPSMGRRDIFSALRRALTPIRTRGGVPTAYVVAPSIAERLETLLVDANYRPYFETYTGARFTMFGLPVYESPFLEYVPSTVSVVVGDFTHAVLFDRETLTVAMSDSHEDYFAKNLVAIRAELRARPALTYPGMFTIINIPEGAFNNP